MPKSKRDRKIALSKTTKKVGLETKQVWYNNIFRSSIFKNTEYFIRSFIYSFIWQAIVDKIRSNVDNYPRLFVFSIDNMRNLHFKHVRETWKAHSTFVMGKNRIMSLALGRDEAEEYAEKVRFYFIRKFFSKL